jgi:hypothetical protein
VKIRFVEFDVSIGKKTSCGVRAVMSGRQFLIPHKQWRRQRQQ